MNNTAKMASLLRTLRTQTNGAVVEAMSARGVDYELSYGVSVGFIREAAADYAPDHELALALYTQHVRELRIASTYIADPSSITEDQIIFWQRGIDGVEIARHVALLLGRTSVAECIVLRWLTGQDEILIYAALMTGTRALSQLVPLAWESDVLIALLDKASRTDSLLIDQGLSAFIGRLWRQVPASRNYLAPLLERIKESRPYLWHEIEWQLT